MLAEVEEMAAEVVEEGKIRLEHFRTSIMHENIRLSYLSLEPSNLSKAF